jgi:RNase H-like domain found in reverse transcriptase
MGAILLQEGDMNSWNPLKKFLHPIAYYLASFIAVEWNYDIYERELLAVVKAFKYWQAHLGWTKFPITVVTDHANLAYWKEPKDLSRRTARWHTLLQDYWFNIQITPGKNNIAANFLSQPPHAEQGENDNKGIMVIVPTKFVPTEYRIGNEQRGLPTLANGWNLPWDNRDPPIVINVFDMDLVYHAMDDLVLWAQCNHPILLEE